MTVRRSGLVRHRPVAKGALINEARAKEHACEVPWVALDALEGREDLICWAFEGLEEAATARYEQTGDTSFLIIRARSAKDLIELREAWQRTRCRDVYKLVHD